MMRNRGKGLGALLAALVAWWFVPTSAQAEPYIAAREGLRCTSCHANLTGGGLRNNFGRNYARKDLPITYWAPWRQEGASGGEPIDTAVIEQLSRYVSAGVDFRVANTTRHQPASSVGPTPKMTSNEFAVQEANLYLQVHLIPEHLSFYLDEQVLSPAGALAFTREAFGLFQGLPGNAFIKAGMFYLPYGLRLRDDSAFIRGVTGVNFGASDVGVELGADPGPLSIRVALSNGTRSNTDTNADKEVSVLAALVHKRGRIGASVDYNDMGSGMNRLMHNVFAAFTISRLTVLGEVDRIVDDIGGGTVKQHIAFVEGDVLITEGVNFKGVYEYLDPQRGVGGDGRHRVSVLLEVFPTQFSQLTLGARIAEGPKGMPTARADEYFTEVHLFF